MAKGRKNYQENCEAAKKLADLVGEKSVSKAYFEGDVASLEKAVDEKLGKGKWDEFIKATESKKWDEATKLLKPPKT